MNSRKKWVCKDWYFEIEQSHVRAYANKPDDCFFKRQRPEGERQHTARCGWYSVEMTPYEGKRTPTSPTGPEMLTCIGKNHPYAGKGTTSNCGHSWADHDDMGCVYIGCECYEPGERK